MAEEENAIKEVIDGARREGVRDVLFFFCDILMQRKKEAEAQMRMREREWG